MTINRLVERFRDLCIGAVIGGIAVWAVRESIDGASFKRRESARRGRSVVASAIVKELIASVEGGEAFVPALDTSNPLSLPPTLQGVAQTSLGSQYRIWIPQEVVGRRWTSLRPGEPVLLERGPSGVRIVSAYQLDGITIAPGALLDDSL